MNKPPFGKRFVHFPTEAFCAFSNRSVFFFLWLSYTVYKIYKYHIQQLFSLKLSPTALFTYLKIILLQCFLFLVISGIQTNSKYDM